MKSRKLASALALGACAAVMAGAPSASADTYAPGANNQDFATGAGGWSNSSSSTGPVCIATLTCPTVTNSFVATDGAGGASDGFIRSNVLGIAALVSTSDGVWTSPAFTYNGNGGGTPTSVTFTMSRRSDVAAILAIPGDAATYSVDLLDNTAPSAVPVIAATTQAGATDWTAVPAASVSPGQLTIGHSYSIRITSEYMNDGASVLPMGNADYDNVVLSTAGGTGSAGGGGTGTGAGGGAGGGVAGAHKQCLLNAKKKIKKKKLTGKKRTKALKKAKRNCSGKKKFKKKKTKKRH